MTDEEIIEIKTIAHSKGMQQGIMIGLAGVQGLCYVLKNSGETDILGTIIKYCEKEIAKTKEMLTPGE